MDSLTAMADLPPVGATVQLLTEVEGQTDTLGEVLGYIDESPEQRGPRT